VGTEMDGERPVGEDRHQRVGEHCEQKLYVGATHGSSGDASYRARLS
jgi:hypothetical protein